VLAVRNAGFAVDDRNLPGFSGMLAGLLTEGSATRDSKAIAEAAQALGGSVGAGSGNDGIRVFGNALASRAPQMLSLLAEVVRTPTFPDREVELAKANAMQGLKASEAQPGFRAERALVAAIYGDHPYARTQQTEASIRAVTPDQLRSAHAARFRPDRALLVIAGRIEPAAAFRAAEAAFGDWKASGPALPDPAPARASAPPQRILIQRDRSVQSAIRLGRPAIPVAHPDFYPLQLAGTVLGGGFSSRLMQNLREDKGYTYGAGGGLSALRLGGRLGAQTDVRNEVTGAANRCRRRSWRTPSATWPAAISSAISCRARSPAVSPRTGSPACRRNISASTCRTSARSPPSNCRPRPAGTWIRTATASSWSATPPRSANSSRPTASSSRLRRPRLPRTDRQRGARQRPPHRERRPTRAAFAFAGRPFAERCAPRSPSPRGAGARVS
jgi:hypothetical protein